MTMLDAEGRIKPLVERLRQAAQEGREIIEPWQLDPNLFDEAADSIELLRERLGESYEENLYAALHTGVTDNEGKWWPGGLSDGEWFCRQADIRTSPEFTKDELLARVPMIALKMVERLLGKEREPGESVHNG